MAVELPLPPKELSPNGSHRHWSVRYRATKSYRKLAGQVFALYRSLRGLGNVEIDIEYRCARGASGYVAHDVANAIAALKPAIDGMVDAGVIPSDSRWHLGWGRLNLITSKRDPAWKARGDGVTVTVRGVA